MPFKFFDNLTLHPTFLASVYDEWGKHVRGSGFEKVINKLNLFKKRLKLLHVS